MGIVSRNISNLDKVKLDESVLMIIDMQNDFIAEGAPVEAAGGRDIVPTIKTIAGYLRNKGVPVIYTQEIHRKELIDFGLELEREEPLHCIEGSKGVEIVDELMPEPQDHIIQKRRYSPFYGTDLDVLLKGLGKKTLLLTGVGTNVCVYAAALDGQQLGYRIVALRDGTAGAEAYLHEAFLRNIDYVLGDVVTMRELMMHFETL
jgi:nicotinamidase-related amidase